MDHDCGQDPGSGKTEGRTFFVDDGLDDVLYVMNLALADGFAFVNDGALAFTYLLKV